MALPTSPLHADTVIPTYFETELRKKTAKFVVEQENESYTISDSLRIELKTATVGSSVIDSCTWEHYGLWQINLIVPKDTDLDLYTNNLNIIACIMEDDTNLDRVSTNPPCKIERVGNYGNKSYMINASIGYSFQRQRRTKTGTGC